MKNHCSQIKFPISQALHITQKV